MPNEGPVGVLSWLGAKLTSRGQHLNHSGRHGVGDVERFEIYRLGTKPRQTFGLYVTRVCGLHTLDVASCSLRASRKPTMRKEMLLSVKNGVQCRP